MERESRVGDRNWGGKLYLFGIGSLPRKNPPRAQVVPSAWGPAQPALESARADRGGWPCSVRDSGFLRGLESHTDHKEKR